MKSVLIFIAVVFSLPSAEAHVYSEKGLRVDFPSLDSYEAFPGMFGTLVTFISNSNKELPSTFSVAIINSPYPSNFFTNKDALNTYEFGLERILQSKGATEIKDVDVSSEKWGSHKGLSFMTRYQVNGQKYQETAILMSAGKTKSLSISFQSPIKNFKTKWRQINLVLQQMKIRATP